MQSRSSTPCSTRQESSFNLAARKVTDAWIASATESSSEHLVTFDRDFLKLLSPSDFTLLTVETESD